MITALAGGVGAAKFLTGLCDVVGAETVTAVVNTADDLCRHGLYICPDLDTVAYTLAGVVDSERGWGRSGETWTVMDALDGLAPAAPHGSDAAATWFRLGDQDLATHLYRTRRQAEGASLSVITTELASALGVATTILPMTDDVVRTRVTLAAGPGGTTEEEVDFQDYFVRRGHAVAVTAMRYAGAEVARAAPGVVDALDRAEVIVICPSNPFCSIAPILAVAEIRAAMVANRDRVVAVSPLVGGRALRGPADRLMVELGHRPDVAGVARIYAPVAAALVIDPADAGLAPAVGETGVGAVVIPSIMHDAEAAAGLARASLEAMGWTP